MASLGYQWISAWRDLEADAGASLIWMNGLLNVGDPNYQSGPEGNLMAPIPNMERLGLPYEILNVAQIMQRYPFRGLPGNFVGIFAPDNGCIDVPLLLRSLYRLPQAYGAKFQAPAEGKDFNVPASRGPGTLDNGQSQTGNAPKR